MKWLVVVLFLVPNALCWNLWYPNPAVPHAQQDLWYGNRDSDACYSVDAECVTNPGIKGQCRQTCKSEEQEATGAYLCGESCKCCTEVKDRCAETYPGSYCGPSPCDANKFEIMDTTLCEGNYACCRSKPANKHRRFRRGGGGVKGMSTAHFITFDGLKFRYDGFCTYLLVKENVENPRFKVWANHAKLKDQEGQFRAMVKSVEVEVSDVSVNLVEGNRELLVDGVNIIDKIDHNTKEEYEVKGMTFSFANRRRLLMKAKDMFSLEWNGRGYLRIDLDDNMIGTPGEDGHVAGLLGNANGDKTDDLIERMPDGTYERIKKLKEEEEVSDADLIRYGLSWMRDCDKAV